MYLTVFELRRTSERGWCMLESSVRLGTDGTSWDEQRAEPLPLLISPLPPLCHSSTLLPPPYSSLFTAHLITAVSS